MSKSHSPHPPSVGPRSSTLDERIDALAKRGVIIIDPRQCFIDHAVQAERIAPGVVLWPGTRLMGERTALGPGVEVGTEGPATIKDSVLERDVQVASGFISGSLCLSKVKVGAQSHIRPGCLLEEEVSTAHCVGLKQTILLSYATLGSLINFCDCLMAGGSSAKSHAEVGSGYIHFNYTPWGERGDKATPSLIGDVTRGVFLDQPRIFLGGSSGMVGPRSVGFGSVTAAGQVLRQDVPDQRLVGQAGVDVDRPWSSKPGGASISRFAPNLEYIAQLFALRAWYEEVRAPRAAGDRFAQYAIEHGVGIVDGAVAERLKQLGRYLQDRGREPFSLAGFKAPALGEHLAGLDLRSKESHLEWVKSLDATAKERIFTGLQAIVNSLRSFARDYAE